MDAVVTREKAIEFFGKETIELAESFCKNKSFWTDFDESEKRNYLLRGAIHSGTDAETFRSKYDNLQISLSPDKVAVWIEKLDKLQKEEGGIPVIESVITYLRRNQIECAKRLCFYDGDKIRAYPKMLALLKETLMKNEQWWYPNR